MRRSENSDIERSPCRDRGVPIHLHSDGHILEIIPDLIDCGVNVINPQVRANGIDELARALVGLKRGREAEASALQAKELKPDNPNIYLFLANAHIQQQKFAAVVQDFDEYLKLVPNGPGSDQIRQRRDRMRDALQRDATQQVPY